MALTKEALEGLDWARKHIEVDMKKGMSAEKAMHRVDIESVSDILFFMFYLDEHGHKDLLKAIKNEGN